jgi:oligoribonuclease NrnB/cAMP/cGMP phosphodiesterase (DHH superfamily)
MNYIIFHAKKTAPFVPCIDGLFAAAAAALSHEVMGLPFVVVPAQYGAENAPQLSIGPEDAIYLLDLSYPAYILNGWRNSGAFVTILDHHKTAIDDLSGLSDRILKEFDLDRSGAMISWNFFFKNIEAPEIVAYVQDRDLWTKRLPDCDLIASGLASMMRIQDLEGAMNLAKFLLVQPDQKAFIQSLKTTGMAVKVLIDNAVEDALLDSSSQIVGGYQVPFVRARTEYQKIAYSDIGNALLEFYPSAPFACVEVGGGWALRSKSDRLDVEVVAKSLGGGGHRNASGCRSGNPRAW